MGVGMVAVVQADEKEEALQLLDGHFKSFELGTVTEEPGIRVKNYGIKF
jgi:phosphoribosylformylglycinamidine cyclo-ligase